MTEAATAHPADSFDPATLELLRAEREVEIETSRAPGTTPRRATIWVVVDPRDRVFVRSWRAAAGRWYQDLLANPPCALRHGGTVIPAVAVPADDEQIQACSEALVSKYGGRASTASMLTPETLVTTLRLVPH